MKALVCTAHGSLDNLAVGEADTPQPDDDEVLVAVEAAGVSFVDTLMVADKHQVHHPVPFSPGMEVAGRAAAVGAGVAHIRKGERVAAVLGDGGHAAFARAKGYETFALPDDCDTVVTAAVLTAALTADLSLVDRARVAPGETVLVGGSAGAIGLCAIQLAKGHGARVVAAASSEERCALASEAGADAAIVYGEGFRDRLKEANGGRDADIVIDPVGGAFAEAAADALDWNGRYVIVGFAGGMPPPFKGNRLLIKNRAALGMVLGYYRWHRPELLAASAARVFAAIAAGTLAPPVTVLDGLGGIPDVLKAIAARTFTGKAVARLT